MGKLSSFQNNMKILEKAQQIRKPSTCQPKDSVVPSKFNIEKVKSTPFARLIKSPDRDIKIPRHVPSHMTTTRQTERALELPHRKLGATQCTMYRIKINRISHTHTVLVVDREVN